MKIGSPREITHHYCSTECRKKRELSDIDEYIEHVGLKANPEPSIP